MAKLYSKQTWVDEVLAGLERYNIYADDGVTPVSLSVAIALTTGVLQAGTPVDAAHLQHIDDGLDAVDTRTDTLLTAYNEHTHDHGALTGLGDDDHPQYFNVARLTKAVIDALLINADTLDGSHASAFALAAAGVTNGNSHDHAGGDGGQVDHGGLAGLGDDDHAQYYNSARHTKAAHDALNINADQVDGYHAAGIPGLYVPVAATGLADSAGNSWGAGNARAVGTYTFRPADNSNIWPATARAVQLFVFSQWAAANNSSILSTRRSSSGTNEGQVRALISAVGYSIGIIQAVDENGYFYINIANADTTSSTIRILGYYL